MAKRRRTPEQIAADFIAWIETPKAKKRIRKAAKEAKELADKFKQRPFTAEELNRRY